MTSSVSGQDKPNPALWLATWVGRWTTCCVRQKNFHESHTINPLFTKLVWSRWLDIGLVLFWVLMDLDFVSVHKHTNTNLANIQPSWPHTWSITHISWPRVANHCTGFGSVSPPMEVLLTIMDLKACICTGIHWDDNIKRTKGEILLLNINCKILRTSQTISLDDWFRQQISVSSRLRVTFE